MRFRQRRAMRERLERAVLEGQRLGNIMAERIAIRRIMQKVAEQEAEKRQASMVAA